LFSVVEAIIVIDRVEEFCDRRATIRTPNNQTEESKWSTYRALLGSGGFSRGLGFSLGVSLLFLFLASERNPALTKTRKKRVRYIWDRTKPRIGIIFRDWRSKKIPFLTSSPQSFDALSLCCLHVDEGACHGGLTFYLLYIKVVLKWYDKASRIDVVRRTTEIFSRKASFRPFTPGTNHAKHDKRSTKFPRTPIQMMDFIQINIHIFNFIFVISWI
jgi:hypothetical protein